MERKRWETAIRCLEVALHPNTADEEAIAAVRAFRRTAAGTPLSQMCGLDAGDSLELAADNRRLRAKLARLLQEQTGLRQELAAAEAARAAAVSRLAPLELELRLARDRAEEAERSFAQFRAATGERRTRPRPQTMSAPRDAAEPKPSFQSALAAARNRVPWTA